MAVQRTNDEQLLLNLVRLKYRDTPFFLEVSSVASQLTLKTNASVSASLKKSVDALFGLGGGLALEERPTVTYSPLQGEKFIERVLSPISLETIALLYHSGWSVERLVRVCLQRFNELKNAPGATGPTPQLAPEYEDFLQASQILRSLQKKGVLELALTSHKGHAALALHIDHQALEWQETRELASYFDGSPETQPYILSPVLSPDTPNHIRVESRSLLGILFYLSQSVEVPAQDEQLGKVTVTRLPSGAPFDWKQVTGDLFRIKSQSLKPESSAVSVYYRGAWFYIDDSDLDSKSTFSLLSQIFSLQAGKVQSTAPLLTLPVGQ